MIFLILVILLLIAVGFFHYVQGFFSSTISAVLSILSAVIALSYYESVVEGPLAGVWVNWMPSLTLLLMYALIYTILRTLFDKMVPGGMQVPAVVDKVGGAAMGLVAGIFAVGIVVVAAQQMPFGPSIAGYTRYPTSGSKSAPVPVSPNASPKESNTYDEMEDPRFDPDKQQKLLIPVDDIVVGLVAHLSDDGALHRRPLESIHPSWLDEMFGQRLGVESGGSRVALNTKDKSQVEVLGVFFAPKLTEQQIVDHEFVRIRGGSSLKVPAEPPGSQKRIVVRVRINPEAADEKDKRIRLSPAMVRLVAPGVDESGSGERVYRNYYPIGTFDPDGRLFVHKIDDFLFIDSKAKKVDDSGDTAPEVDFVFDVKEKGFLTDDKIADGAFLEVKKFGRVALEGDLGVVKSKRPALTMFGMKRKHLELEQGRQSQIPMVHAKGAKPAPPPEAAPAPPEPEAAPPPPPTDTPDVAKGKMLGSWENGEGFNYTFRPDGTYTAALGEKSTDGTWSVVSFKEKIAVVELLSSKGNKSQSQWDLSGTDPDELRRTVPTSATPFKRKQ